MQGPRQGPGAPRRMRPAPIGGHSQAALAQPLGQSEGWGWGRGTHPASTGCSQQLPQAPGHLLHLGQQLSQQAGAPLSPKVLGGRQGRGAQRAEPAQGQHQCLPWASSWGGGGELLPRAEGGGIGDGGTAIVPGNRTVSCPLGGACVWVGDHMWVTLPGGWMPGAATLTALALLWPRRRWRSCTRCSCCWYHSRPRAIISRPCSSTSCSCSSSFICFSCHTGTKATKPTVGACLHPPTCAGGAPAMRRVPAYTDTGRAARAHTSCTCEPSRAAALGSSAPCPLLGAPGLPQPLHTSSPGEASLLFTAGAGHSAGRGGTLLGRGPGLSPKGLPDLTLGHHLGVPGRAVLLETQCGGQVQSQARGRRPRAPGPCSPGHSPHRW